MKLIRIEDIGAHDEYWDIEVEDTHNFYANGILVHNSNASIVYNGQDMYPQSKGNVLTQVKDNYGFASFVEYNKHHLLNFMKSVYGVLSAEEVVIYGEWAGNGIQKGVAISELPKAWYMFGIKYKPRNVEEYQWLTNPEEFLMPFRAKGIMSIFEFKTWDIEIDFENPKESQNQMIEWMQEVDKECPVGKALGVNGHGEGIVFTGWYEFTKHTFKVKGESHSTTKVKKLSKVDNEREQSKLELAQKITPAWRLEQAYEQVMELGSGGVPTKTKTGAFMKWINNDIIKEETTTIMDAGFEPKEVFGAVSKIAKVWLFDELDKDVGL